MEVSVASETPLQDDVRAMVQRLNEYLIPLSPREFQFQLTAEQMMADDTTVFVARNREGRAIGMGALKVHGDAFGEVKRMYAADAVRGSGVGKRVLDAIEKEARRKCLRLLRLETGSTAGFEPAWRIYERNGFTRCGPFADYPDSAYNVFYEKNLSK
ncbi:GNAT family N-acetyltransferase [Oricola cellulosilytica]|uniref:N-acetyltransferase n=1 Tax=Oricola cellulosilytica TaxID=1429082 RepID=A0A4R0PB62_9HYPH|nr:GNAT family N-acetyltransferase [Oricola cellulosilytica]TCD14490.1 N-acetyltransferase [Oricola cellulosilytica]